MCEKVQTVASLASKSTSLSVLLTSKLALFQPKLPQGKVSGTPRRPSALSSLGAPQSYGTLWGVVEPSSELVWHNFQEKVGEQVPVVVDVRLYDDAVDRCPIGTRKGLGVRLVKSQLNIGHIKLRLLVAQGRARM